MTTHGRKYEQDHHCEACHDEPHGVHIDTETLARKWLEEHEHYPHDPCYEADLKSLKDLLDDMRPKTGFDKFFDAKMKNAEFAADYKKAKQEIYAVDRIIRALDPTSMSKADLEYLASFRQALDRAKASRARDDGEASGGPEHSRRADMTIEDKIVLWEAVNRYASARGADMARTSVEIQRAVVEVQNTVEQLSRSQKK
jgi:hypothetical protein